MINQILQDGHLPDEAHYDEQGDERGPMTAQSHHRSHGPMTARLHDRSHDLLHDHWSHVRHSC